MPKAYCKLARFLPECYLCSGGLLSHTGQVRRDHSDSPEGQPSAVQDKYPSSLAAGGTTLSALRGFPAASMALFPVSDLHKDSMLVSVPRRLAQDCARKPWGHLKETSSKVHSLKTWSWAAVGRSGVWRRQGRKQTSEEGRAAPRQRNGRGLIQGGGWKAARSEQHPGS